MSAVKIEKTWNEELKQEFDKDYFKQLSQFVKQEKQERPIYPSGSQIFAAFNQTPFNKVKVVIIGQDPYHGPSQANGLAFSVNQNVKIPPSLKNIFKELTADLGYAMPVNGNLSLWAKQGVFLLNTVLTVAHKSPASHQDKGWEFFTDATIGALQNRKNLVYMLWGKQAQAKKELIDLENNLVLESTHPSPFSAYRGFLGSQPFSKANAYLIKKGIEPIEWRLN